MRFEEFDHGPSGPVLGVYLLPRRHLTVVTSSQRGPLIVGEGELTPWFSTEQLSAHNVHGIFSIHDAPSLNAAIVLDLDGNVHVLTDDEQWFQVGTLIRNDHGSVFDAPGSDGRAVPRWQFEPVHSQSRSRTGPGFSRRCLAIDSSVRRRASVPGRQIVRPGSHIFAWRMVRFPREVAPSNPERLRGYRRRRYWPVRSRNVSLWANR
jgi:hypothetical protein